MQEGDKSGYKDFKYGDSDIPFEYFKNKRQQMKEPSPAIPPKGENTLQESMRNAKDMDENGRRFSNSSADSYMLLPDFLSDFSLSKSTADTSSGPTESTNYNFRMDR